MPSGSDAAAEVPSTAQQQLDEAIFRRDLFEVYLLIDFISGRTDKTLDDLELTLPGADAPLKGIAVVQEIAKLRYPPAQPPADCRKRSTIRVSMSGASAQPIEAKI